MNNVQTTKELITAHDLTHAYSDDRDVYLRGQREYAEIGALMEDMSEEQRQECRKHWNLEVDNKIAPKFAKDWKVEV